MNVTKEYLIQKYNVPAPRYTSYPTVPLWGDVVPNWDQWKEAVQATFSKTNSEKGISLYIHLPFCEKLCTYCACTKVITKNHTVEEPYLEALLKEWKQYLAIFPGKPIIRELHLGGGTPTFFSPRNLNTLIQGLLKDATLHPQYEFSFEGHPNNTSKEHLQTLYDNGFRRVSLGVQDFDLVVQKTINRIQPFEVVSQVTHWAREIGYTSVNFDLIFGLPKQRPESVQKTFDLVNQLKPDRIAYYSYAHVPWLQKGQRGFSEADIPDSNAKRELYEIGKQCLMELGYEDVGMDHFAQQEDNLFKAQKEKGLHRNFMGYTTSQTSLLIGLGASAISDAGNAFIQNNKDISSYQQMMEESNIIFSRGCLLSVKDVIIRKAILDISCHRELKITPELKELVSEDVWDELDTMKKEGLINLTPNHLQVTDFGMTFLRNICMVFDERMRDKGKPQGPMFSKAI